MRKLIVTVNDDRTVEFSDDLRVNVGENNSTEIAIVLPEEYTSEKLYRYIILRGREKPVFAVPLVNDSYFAGQTITQFAGVWNAIVLVTENEVPEDNPDSARMVFCSNVFPIYVQRNVLSERDGMCDGINAAPEPNVLYIYNDILDLKRKFDEAEAIRVANELIRIANEKTRVANELIRIANEKGRVYAEDIRVRDDLDRTAKLKRLSEELQKEVDEAVAELLKKEPLSNYDLYCIVCLRNGETPLSLEDWLDMVKQGYCEQLVVSRAIDGVLFNGKADVNHYSICESLSDSTVKVVDCDRYLLIKGGRIVVKFVNDNTASNIMLNVNGTGAKPIYYRGEPINSSYIEAEHIYQFVYSGTQYDVIGDINISPVIVNGFENLAECNLVGDNIAVGFMALKGDNFSFTAQQEIDVVQGGTLSYEYLIDDVVFKEPMHSVDIGKHIISHCMPFTVKRGMHNFKVRCSSDDVIGTQKKMYGDMTGALQAGKGLWDGTITIVEDDISFAVLPLTVSLGTISDTVGVAKNTLLKTVVAENFAGVSVSLPVSTNTITAVISCVPLLAYNEGDTTIYVEMSNPIASADLSANLLSFEVTAIFGGTVYTLNPALIELIGLNVLKLTVQTFASAGGDINVLYKNENGNLQDLANGGAVNNFNIAFTPVLTLMEE